MTQNAISFAFGPKNERQTPRRTSGHWKTDSKVFSKTLAKSALYLRVNHWGINQNYPGTRQLGRFITALVDTSSNALDGCFQAKRRLRRPV